MNMRMTRVGSIGLLLLSVSACQTSPLEDAEVGEVAAARAAATATGPRTSPFTPADSSDRNFVTDAARKLDTGCIYSSLGPVEFEIEVTRYAGPLNADGTLRDAVDLVQAGLLSPKATLVIPTFDVDSRATPPPPFQPERDRVSFNGQEIGYLDGENNAWKLNTFQIDIAHLKFAQRGASGSAPTPGKNTVRIDIDVANSPTQVWCTSADWGSLEFRAMSPIILVHGNNSDGGFFVRQGFTAELDAQKLLFDSSISMTTDTVAAHGTVLASKIPELVKGFGVDSIHIVAHSKGGLDSREYLALHQPALDADFRVLSYTTLSTPHNGSVLADLLVQRDAALVRTAELEFSGFPTWTETLVNQVATDVGTTNLTSAFTASFNGRTLPVLSADTVIHTIAADADTNGNAEIDRSPDEYRELRDESATLQTLDGETFGQTKSRIAVNTPYQVLRRVGSVGLRFDTRRNLLGGSRTVAVLTATPLAQAVGNDVLVTIPSGLGVGSVASRTSKSHTFTGANGRNHSNVANRGVATTAVPWIIDVEKTKGDLK